MSIKRFCGVLLVLVLCCSLAVPSFAVRSTSDMVEGEYFSIDIDEEIERALNGETDIAIDATDFAEAVLVKSDGTKENVEVYTTTRSLIVPASIGIDSTIYATTVVASLPATDKVADSSGTKEYVTATVTLFWTDVLGLANEFKGATGSWVIGTNPDTGKKASLSKRIVAVRGTGIGTKGDWYHEYPTSNTFEIKDSAYDDGWWAYEVKSTVTITVDGNASTLTVSASSGQWPA